MNEWEDAKENSDEQFNTYATVLTRVKGRLDADIAMAEEVKKFDAFKTVLDEGQEAIKSGRFSQKVRMNLKEVN